MQQASEIAIFTFNRGSPDRPKRMLLLQRSICALLVVASVACDNHSGAHGSADGDEHFSARGEMFVIAFGCIDEGRGVEMAIVMLDK